MTRAVPTLRSLHRLALLAACLLPCAASAEGRTELLKRCLNDYGGIALTLPYQPSVHIRSCATPDVNYDTPVKTPAGRRELELIGELTLGTELGNVGADDYYAAVQGALFAHFDSLFKRHGFVRNSVAYGDARVRKDPNTLRMLAGLPPVPESAEQAARRIASEPPIPFVREARYVRRDGAGQQTLTYQSQAKNTWRITLEGVAAGGAP
ncbi:MAG: hypothetical protein ABIT83_25850 [Massilia sp.]